MLSDIHDAGPRTKSAPALPKMGAVCRQWVRCGRPSCRCQQGELHGPYFYLFWREDGRLRKRYIRLTDAPAQQDACRDRRQGAGRERDRLRTWRSQWRTLRNQLREVMSSE